MSHFNGCGSNFASFQIGSADAPYVTYEAVGSVSGPMAVSRQWDGSYGFSIDNLAAAGECVEITATHVLTGEQHIQTACTEDAPKETIACWEPHHGPFGCSGGSPSQNWPMLVAVGLLGLALLRRRRSEDI